jgi:hypothetical protein
MGADGEELKKEARHTCQNMHACPPPPSCTFAPQPWLSASCPFGYLADGVLFASFGIHACLC